MDDIEIEIKLPLENPEDVKSFLEKNGKNVARNLKQKDTYFVPSHRDFMDFEYPFEWLRIRETSNGSFITYKYYHPENVARTDYCDEFESKIENASSLRKIFNSLNIKELVTVDKIRNSWMLDGVEVSIDDVNSLGTFIELEAKKGFKDPKEGRRFLFGVLEKLSAKVGDEPNWGYPMMILRR